METLGQFFAKVEAEKRKSYSKERRIAEWKASSNSEIYRADENMDFWIRGKEGDKTFFLMAYDNTRNYIVCAGMCDLIPLSPVWSASINAEYDEETDTDLEEVYRGRSFDHAIEALWDNREDAYLF